MLWASMQTSQIETGALGPEHEVNKMNEYQLPSTDPYDDPYELRFIRDAPNCDEYYI